MTSVGLGNPYLKKEPIDFTKQADALLTNNPEKSRTYWFLYDRIVQVAAMGIQAVPQADVCRLLCRFRDSIGFRAEVCEQVRYIIVSSGKRPVSLRIVHIGPPPDLSIPRHQFDPISWEELPWQGCSCVFQLDEKHLELMKRPALKQRTINQAFLFVEHLLSSEHFKLT
ncbi:Chaperone protein DnaJ [Durusdinium trenchii]|uniref:Chaperone protein DnaJ n=1 Tax=Durusdinium trenchii TaxID=1381693 RepID=A0ABP0IRK8_9DINO